VQGRAPLRRLALRASLAAAVCLALGPGGAGAGCASRPPAAGPKDASPAVHARWPFDAAEARRRQEETAGRLGMPVEKTVDLGGGVEMLFVLIPAGEFTMGSPPDEAGRHPDEGPLGRVRITRPFHLGKFEVTQAEWEKVTGRNPSERRGPRRPVEAVNVHHVRAFLERLNALAPGAGTFRLPTEAEWEYAARGPDSTVYPWGDDFDIERANVVNSVAPKPVGGYPSGASWVGALDMAGNAMEWVADWLDPAYYATGPAEDPPGPATGTVKVEKGGWWGSNEYVARSAYRHFEDPPTYGDKHIGFRIVSP
jgi:formylglycine-generating enzyme required for sulfatase activity